MYTDAKTRNTKANQHKLQCTSTLPPVALAMRLRSFLRTLLTAMAPTSTKYLRHMSSMPPVVRITLAPDAKIFWILSLVISDSLEHQNPIIQFHSLYLDTIQYEYNTKVVRPTVLVQQLREKLRP